MEVVFAVLLAATLFGFVVGRRWAWMVLLGIGVVLASLQLIGELSEPNGETHWIYWPMLILLITLVVSGMAAAGVAARQGVAASRQPPS